MTLRSKMFLIAGIGFIFLVTSQFIISNVIFTRNLSQIEQSYTRQDMERVESVISTELSQLESEGLDWSQWDDTYTFAANHNQGYIDSNLMLSTFINLRLNLFIIINTAGDAVYSEAYDSTSNKIVTPAADLNQYLTPYSLLLMPKADLSPRSGILTLSDHILLLTSQPILSSVGSGPSHGTLIMGRYFDSAELALIDELTISTVSIYHYDDPQLPSDVQTFFTNMTTQDIIVKTESAQTIAGYSMENSIFGTPAVVIKGEMPRDIYEQGRQQLLLFLGAWAVGDLIIASMFILLLERQTLSHLTRLSQTVRGLSIKPDISSRLPVSGHDEISTLSKTINEALNALQISQKEIRDKEQKYRNLFEQSRDPIYLTSKEGRFEDLNQSVLDLLGYAKEEMLNRLASEVYSDPADRIRLLEKIQSQGSVKDFKVKLKRKDGETLDCLITAGMRIDDSGRLLGYQGIIRDVTEQYRTQEALQNSYNNERKLRLDLQKEIATRIDFSNALVHELKTPLTPISASSELLMDELHTEPWHSIAKNINDGANSLSQRINELLELSRIEMGTMSLNVTIVDISKLLHDTIEYMLPLVIDNNQSLKLDLPSELPQIMVDPERIKQIMLNLIVNAVKYSDSGASTLVRASQLENELLIEVQDHGRGMTKEVKEHIFDPYYRAEGNKQNLSGMGLGLTIVKSLVELHGGHIMVESVINQGSTFSFSLPLHKSGI